MNVDVLFDQVYFYYYFLNLNASSLWRTCLLEGEYIAGMETQDSHMQDKCTAELHPWPWLQLLKCFALGPPVVVLRGHCWQCAGTTFGVRD